MRPPDVEAKITLRGTDAGGRDTAVSSGYRPQHRVLPDYLTSGTHTYREGSSLAPGGTAVGTITFIKPDAYPHCLSQGDIIEISEGTGVRGCARILRVLNPLLERAAGVDVTVADYASWTADSNPLPESFRVVDFKSSKDLVAELQRELRAGHALFERKVRAVGRSQPQNDVLFELLEGDRAVFVVRLPANREPSETSPDTTRFGSLGQFFSRWPREGLDA